MVWRCFEGVEVLVTPEMGGKTAENWCFRPPQPQIEMCGSGTVSVDAPGRDESIGVLGSALRVVVENLFSKNGFGSGLAFLSYTTGMVLSVG